MTDLSDAVGSDVDGDVSEPAPTAKARRWFNPFTQRLPWWGEASVAIAFYLMYDVVQAMTQSDQDEATAHGLDIVHAEKTLHIWAEPDINHWATAHHWFALIAGYDYGIAHVFMTAAVLGFVWSRYPRVEIALRNTILGFSIAALFVYWQYPVSPPRFVVPGLTDTLTSNDILGSQHSYHGFVNLYAAMPSLHVAWAVWCAAAIVLALRSPWRHFAWLYPCWTTLVVVSTANHYFLDAAAGLGLAAVPLTVVSLRLRR